MADVRFLLWFYLIAVNLITFCSYGVDKYRARHNQRRIPEAVLHALTLFGGTIGALAGQRFFGHKTKKLTFRLIFIAIIMIQAVVISWWILNKR